MRNKISEYHLHKDDYSKLHFELKDINTHLAKNKTHVFKAHRHSFYMFVWFKDKGKHFVDYEEVSHPANSLFLIKKNQIHYFCRDSSNEGLTFHFDEFFLSKASEEQRNKITFSLFNETGSPFITLDQESINTFASISEKISYETTNRGHNHRKLIFNYMQILILIIERLKVQHDDIKLVNDRNLEVAIHFNREVEQNMHTFLSVDTYSKRVNVSPAKLTSISRNYFAMSPSKYVAFKKILEAKRLLSNVQMPIKQVGYQLGFDQATYFTKYFKKHTGLTPKDFISVIPK